jgi:hypothetical protein
VSNQPITQTLKDEAVAHARLAEQSGVLSWRHIFAEYTQDSYKIADTLATNAPIAWTLALPSEADGGAYRFLIGTNAEEVRGQYENLRSTLEIHGWEALVEIRSSWYTMFQGVSTLKIPSTGQMTKGVTAVLFPVGTDGILGELQIGTVGRLADGSAPAEEGRLPSRRMAVMTEHEEYILALRAENVDRIVSAYRHDATIAIRSYLADESSLLNVNGADAIATYYKQLFQRYRVLDVQLVNRVCDTWYWFAELHWTVEERGGPRRTMEFCTADMTAIDPDRKYWVCTNAGTDPVEVKTLPYRPRGILVGKLGFRAAGPA